jgi:hypothetical protein
MKWKTKDGRVIEISDMTDSHLSNAFNMVYRKAIEKQHEHIFDGLFAWASILSNELLRRDMHSHEHSYSNLEAIFMTYDDSDFQEPMWRDADMDLWLNMD